MAPKRRKGCEASHGDDRGGEASEVKRAKKKKKKRASVKKMKTEETIKKMPGDAGGETDRMLFDESCVFVSRGCKVGFSPGMKEHRIELRQPCKECPELTLKEKNKKAEYELVAKAKFYVVSRRFVKKCAKAGDYSRLGELFDETQETLDLMRYCTNLPPLAWRPMLLKEKEGGPDVHGIYRGYPSRPGLDELKGCVLVDDWCLTHKKWAGHGYGIFMLNTALKKLMPSGSIGPVFLKPFPLQWDRCCSYRQVFIGEDPAGPYGFQFTGGQLEKLKHDKCKLVQHYIKCGFYEVPGSGKDEPYFMRSAVPGKPSAAAE